MSARDPSDPLGYLTRLICAQREAVEIAASDDPPEVKYRRLDAAFWQLAVASDDIFQVAVRVAAKANALADGLENAAQVLQLAGSDCDLNKPN